MTETKDPKKIPVIYAELHAAMAFPNHKIPQISTINPQRTGSKSSLKIKAYLTPAGLWLEQNDIPVGVVPVTNIKGMEFHPEEKKNVEGKNQ